MALFKKTSWRAWENEDGKREEEIEGIAQYTTGGD